MTGFRFHFTDESGLGPVPEQGSGLSAEKGGGLALCDDLVESVEQSIKMILSTVPGERVMRPEYGSRLHELAFENHPEGLAIQYIREALERFEPRVRSLPPGGCAGPYVLDVGEHLRFVFIDIAGFDHMTQEPEEHASECRKTRDALEAFFDLSASLSWLLSGRVRRVWLEGVPTVARAELVPGVPDFGQPMPPDTEDDDWYFPAPDLAWIEATEERGTWVVGLLDLGRHRYVELLGEPGPSGTIRIPGAADRVERIVRRTEAPVAWYLDYRVDDTTVARAAGRRVGRSGTREESDP